MVVVEVVAAVLRGGEAGDAFFGEAVDVFAGFGRAAEGLCADGVEDLGDGVEPGAEGGLAGPDDAVGVSGAEVGFERADVVGDVAGVILHVGGCAFGALFFAHPGDEADGAFGVDAELLQEVNGLHGDDDAGAVIDGSGAEVP